MKQYKHFQQNKIWLQTCSRAELLWLLEVAGLWGSKYANSSVRSDKRNWLTVASLLYICNPLLRCLKSLCLLNTLHNIFTDYESRFPLFVIWCHSLAGVTDCNHGNTGQQVSIICYHGNTALSSALAWVVFKQSTVVKASEGHVCLRGTPLRSSVY